ncbi:MAG: folate-binding protein YgfZ [Gemmatimonadota bacterium]|nr:MAG: folate-binding protein YgfZ [Gemmatimonadota bacterium]
MDREIAGLLEGAGDLGDWEAECRAFHEGCALALRADRCTVIVTGERRAEMLNGLVTNQVTELGHTGRHALLLNRKGRVLTDLRVLPRVTDLLLDLPRSGSENLLATFRKYLPPIYAGFEDASESLGEVGLYGPQTAGVCATLGVRTPDEHLGVREIELADAPALLIRNRRLARDGVELVAPREALPDLIDLLLRVVREHGGRAAGSRALDVARVESGIPEYGVDVSQENLTRETGLEGEAVSFDKGCYLGQEIVARVHFRGQVKRLLRTLKFYRSAMSSEAPEGRGELPAPGAALRDRDGELGTVTSAVRSPRFGPIGLGYLRTEVAVSEVSPDMTWSAAGREGVAVIHGPPLQPFEKETV